MTEDLLRFILVCAFFIWMSFLGLMGAIVVLGVAHIIGAILGAFWYIICCELKKIKQLIIKLKGVFRNG